MRLTIRLYALRVRVRDQIDEMGFTGPAWDDLTSLKVSVFIDVIVVFERSLGLQCMRCMR